MIPVFRPSMGEEEIRAIEEVLNSGWIGLGPKTKQFEEEFAKYIGVKHAVAVNSATAALHLSLVSLDINAGEVIVPAITFVSTALAANYVGAKPVFADVEEDTLNISVENIKKKITNKTKAIIPVHYGGYPCKMDEINELAEKHDIKVIEDASHACGSVYKGKKAGALADLGCFSFHAVKNLATGDGGMITTNNEKIKEKLHRLRWCGITKDTFSRTKKNYSWYYEVPEIGFKYHMNDITAAIGLVQLKKLEQNNEKRRRIVKQYNEVFSKTSWIEVPKEEPNTKSAMHNYVIKVKETKDRDNLIEYLAKKEISASVHYMPLHLHPIYRQYKAKVPVAEKVWKRLVTLPLYPDMTEEETEKVIDAVKNFKK